LTELAEIAGRTLSWDEARQRAEIQDLLDELAKRHRTVVTETGQHLLA
jgi:hypothetical protein